MQVAKLAKERIDDLDAATLGLARPAGGVPPDHSPSSADDSVPQHFHQCALRPCVSFCVFAQPICAQPISVCVCASRASDLCTANVRCSILAVMMLRVWW